MRLILLLTFGILALCPCRAQRAATKGVLMANVQNDFTKERELLRWKHSTLSAGVRYEKTMLRAAVNGLMENNRQYTIPLLYRRELGNGLFWETALYAGLSRCNYTTNVLFPNEAPPLAATNELLYGVLAGFSLRMSDHLRLNLHFRDTFGTGPDANFGKLRLGWQVRF